MCAWPLARSHTKRSHLSRSLCAMGHAHGAWADAGCGGAASRSPAIACVHKNRVQLQHSTGLTPHTDHGHTTVTRITTFDIGWERRASWRGLLVPHVSHRVPATAQSVERGETGYSALSLTVLYVVRRATRPWSVVRLVVVRGPGIRYSIQYSLQIQHSNSVL